MKVYEKSKIFNALSKRGKVKLKMKSGVQNILKLARVSEKYHRIITKNKYIC